MYALFHGQDDLKNIAKRIHSHTKELADKISKLGHEIVTNDNSFFDTIVINTNNMANRYYFKALNESINLRQIDKDLIGISLDETTRKKDIVNRLGETDYQKMRNLISFLSRVEKEKGAQAKLNNRMRRAITNKRDILTKTNFTDGINHNSSALNESEF